MKNRADMLTDCETKLRVPYVRKQSGKSPLNRIGQHFRTMRHMSSARYITDRYKDGRSSDYQWLNSGSITAICPS